MDGAITLIIFNDDFEEIWGKSPRDGAAWRRSRSLSPCCRPDQVTIGTRDDGDGDDEIDDDDHDSRQWWLWWRHLTHCRLPGDIEKIDDDDEDDDNDDDNNEDI